MTTPAENISRRAVSLLNTVSDEHGLSSALTKILDMLLPVLGADGGAIRVYGGQDKSGFTADAGNGNTSFCFSNLEVTDCVCGTALQNGSGKYHRKL